MNQDDQVSGVVDWLNDLLWTDSRVRIPESVLQAAVLTDYTIQHCLPTRDECEDLVMGEEGDPVVDDLREQFVNIDRVISAQF